MIFAAARSFSHHGGCAARSAPRAGGAALLGRRRPGDGSRRARRAGQVGRRDQVDLRPHREGGDYVRGGRGGGESCTRTATTTRSSSRPRRPSTRSGRRAEAPRDFVGGDAADGGYAEDGGFGDQRRQGLGVVRVYKNHAITLKTDVALAMGTHDFTCADDGRLLLRRAPVRLPGAARLPGDLLLTRPCRMARRSELREKRVAFTRSRHATCAARRAGAAGVRPEVEARPWPLINPAPNSDEAPELAAGEPRERNHEREMTPSSDLPNSSLTFRALQLYDRSGARALALLASDALSAGPFDLEGATGRVPLSA